MDNFVIEDKRGYKLIVEKIRGLIVLRISRYGNENIARPSKEQALDLARWLLEAIKE